MTCFSLFCNVFTWITLGSDVVLMFVDITDFVFFFFSLCLFSGTELYKLPDTNT